MSKLFFLFPDPHFKKTKHKWRIIRCVCKSLGMLSAAFVRAPLASCLPGSVISAQGGNERDGRAFEVIRLSTSVVA